MIVTPYISPVTNPVSLTEAKLHLRVDHSTDDSLISSQIDAATEWCEKYEGQAYVMRSYKAYLPRFQTEITLPFPPLVTVSSVQYYDTAGDLQTLSTDVYTVDNDSMPGRIYLTYGQNWPSTYPVPKAVIITYTTGYATPFTIADATFVDNKLTLGNAVFAAEDLVRVTTDQSDLPSPLVVGTNYYVSDVSGSTIKLETTVGGGVVDIADAGTGTHFIGFGDMGSVPERVRSAIKLAISHLYEHRGDENIEIPSSVKNLLMERIF